ncbi:MAG: hypothetical protein K8I02_07660, partial [Candidatus Methylomirabilis sp.]|nr:hypothetical protein [Deltaproteobacteria bacterium]
MGSTIHLSQGCEITTFDLHGTVLSRRSLCDKLAGASLTALFPVEVSGDDASEYVLDHDLSMNATQVVSHDGALMWKADSRERFKSTYGDLDGDGRTEFVRAGYKWIE